MPLTHPITHEEIAARAHAIWEECGRREGCALEHWLRAERELQKEWQQAEEFRAGLSGPLPKPAASLRHEHAMSTPPRPSAR